MGQGCAGDGRRQEPQAAPKNWFNSQPAAGLTHGSPAAFIVSRELLHEVQLIGFKSKRRRSFIKLRATGCMKITCLVKVRLTTSFLRRTFLKDNLVFIASFSFRTGAHVPVPLRSTTAGLGGAQPSPHLENVLHTLVDELHVDDVQQGGCWKHLPPATQQTDGSGTARIACQVCEMSAVLLASGCEGPELAAGGHEGDPRRQASALNDPRERLVKNASGGRPDTSKTRSDKGAGESPGCSSKAGEITLTFKGKTKSKLHSAKPLSLESCFSSRVKLFPLPR